MSKEHLERFMTQVADSEDLQGKIGEEVTGDALVALGAAHGCEFSIEDVQAGAELSDAEMEGASGGVYAGVEFLSTHKKKSYTVRFQDKSKAGGTKLGLVAIHN